MSKLNKKDRASLCLFTFSDGRRCRTPRLRNHPHFCFDHAQKETRARATATIGKDLAYFFSGDYVSACDLSTALARILPAVVRGDIKPKTARTVAYLAQTLLQSIRLAQHEYIEALSTNGWRNAICNSVNQNHDYLFPPKPAPPSPVVAGLQTAMVPTPQSTPPPTAPTVAPLNVGAGLQPGPHLQPAPTNPQPASTPPQPAARPAQTPANCHSERGEESAVSSPSTPSPTSPPASQSPAPTTGATPHIPAAHPSAPPPSNPPQPTPVGHLGIHPDPVGRSQALPLPVRRRFHRTD